MKKLAHNIVIKLPGNDATLENLSSPLEYWQLLINENILSTIVESTNIYISSIATNFQRERDARSTNIPEIKAFIGLLYFAGFHKSSHVNVRELWLTDGTGLDIFHRSMLYN